MKLMKKHYAKPSHPAMGFSGLFDNLMHTDPFFENRLSNKPSVNIKELDEMYQIEMAVPGFEKESFNLEVEGDLLKISAEVKEEHNSEEENYTRKEFSFQSFERSFTLPETVDANKIEASYTNGILNINLPKREEAKVQPPRKINIS
jgi:HSP20 family protein